MNIIKIDRLTIREVPPPMTPWVITGHLFTENGIPECLMGESIFVTQWIGSGSVSEIQFHVEDLDEYKRVYKLAECMKKPQIYLEAKRDLIEMTCQDNYGAFNIGPQKTFSYESTPVQCTDCGAWTPYKDIEQSTYINEDGDEFDHDKCPFCKELDTFEYQFERL